MRLQRFLAVVPRAMRTTAVTVAAILITAGLIGGTLAAHTKNIFGPMGLYWIAALVLGIVTGLWLLAVGYVFSDARQRGMRATLWIAVVVLFPHLLGFLLYFVMRSSSLARCAQCGVAISPSLRFCPSCGSPQPGGIATDTHPSQASGIGDLR